MKKTITAVISVFIITACGLKTQTYHVSDVTKAEIISLSKHSAQGNIHNLIIIAEGSINEKATISLTLNNGLCKIANISEKIDFQWTGDWYSDTAEIHCQPISATSGKIKLKYRFEDY